MQPQNSGGSGKRIKIKKTDRDIHTTPLPTKRSDTESRSPRPGFPKTPPLTFYSTTQNHQNIPPIRIPLHDIYETVNNQLTVLTQRDDNERDESSSSSDSSSSDELPTPKRKVVKEEVTLMNTHQDEDVIEISVGVPESILQHRKSTRVPLNQYGEGEDFGSADLNDIGQQNEEKEIENIKENHNDEDVSDTSIKRTWKSVYGSGPSVSIMKGVINKFCCTCDKDCTIRWWSYLIGLLFFFLFGAIGAGFVRFTIYLCTGTTVYSIGKLTVTSKIPCAGDFLMTAIIGSSGTLVFLITKYIFKEWMDKLTLYVIAVHTEKMIPKNNNANLTTLSDGHQQHQTPYNRMGIYISDSESDSTPLTTTDTENFDTLF